MVDATAQNVGVEQATDGARPEEVTTRGQSGSVFFPELVRAHYVWERAGGVDGPERDRYDDVLQRFQEEEGELLHAYWATKRPSAVALTRKELGKVAQRFTDHDDHIRLHRVTDWLARESAIAELLHHCDTLAIRVSEVLRGSPERIAMQWLYAVESHLLGFIERTPGRADKAALKEVVQSQSEELIEIERYYGRATTKAARIVYFWGMVAGMLGAITLPRCVPDVLAMPMPSPRSRSWRLALKGSAKIRATASLPSRSSASALAPSRTPLTTPTE